MQKTPYNSFVPTTPIRWLAVLNQDSTPIPAYGVCKPVGVEQGTGAILVKQPDTNNETDVLFCGKASVVPGGYGQATETMPCIAAYEQDSFASDADPVAGEQWGVQAGSWYLQRQQFGFLIVGNPFLGKVNVARDLSAPFAWVQITSTTQTSSRYPGAWYSYDATTDTFTSQATTVEFTGNVTDGSAVATNLSSVGGLYVGDAISFDGSVADTVIASIDSATQITLSQASANTATGLTLTATHGAWIVAPNGELLHKNVYYKARCYGDVAGVPVYVVIGSIAEDVAWVEILSTTQTSGRYPGQAQIYDSSTKTWTTYNTQTSFTGNVTNGSAVVTSVAPIAPATSLWLHVGDPITGDGIPPDTVIASIDSSTQLTLSQASANTATGLTLTDTHYLWVVSPNGEHLKTGTRYRAVFVDDVGGTPVYEAIGHPPVEQGWVTLTSATQTSGRYPGQTSTYDASTKTWTDHGTQTNFTASTTKGSAVLTSVAPIAPAASLWLFVGDEISGPGIPSGAVISSIDSTTQMTLSAAATATATGVTLTDTHECWVVAPNGETLATGTRYWAVFCDDVGGVPVYEAVIGGPDVSATERGWVNLANQVLGQGDKIVQSSSSYIGWAASLPATSAANYAVLGYLAPGFVDGPGLITNAAFLLFDAGITSGDVATMYLCASPNASVPCRYAIVTTTDGKPGSTFTGYGATGIIYDADGKTALARVMGGIVTEIYSTGSGSGTGTGTGTGGGGGGNSISSVALGTASTGAATAATLRLASVTVNAGELLIVSVLTYDSGGNAATIDQAGFSTFGSYSLGDLHTFATVDGTLRVSVLSVKVTATTTGDITIAKASGNVSAMMLNAVAVSGLSTNTSDVFGINHGTSAEPSASAGPTSTANEYAHAAFALARTGATPPVFGAWGGGFTDGSQGQTADNGAEGWGLTEGYEILSATGTPSASLSGSTQDDWAAVMVTYS